MIRSLKKHLVAWPLAIALSLAPLAAPAHAVTNRPEAEGARRALNYAACALAIATATEVLSLLLGVTLCVIVFQDEVS
jgi:hypothetical protein